MSGLFFQLILADLVQGPEPIELRASVWRFAPLPFFTDHQVSGFWSIILINLSRSIPFLHIEYSVLWYFEPFYMTIDII